MRDHVTPGRAIAARYRELAKGIDEFLDMVGAPDLTRQEGAVLAQALLEIELYQNLLSELDLARKLSAELNALEKVEASLRQYSAPRLDVFGIKRHAAIAGLKKVSDYLASLTSEERRLTGRKRSGPITKGAIQIRLAVILGVFGRAVLNAGWHKSAAWHAHHLIDHLNQSCALSLEVPSQKLLLNYLSTYRVRARQERFIRDGKWVHFDPVGSRRSGNGANRSPFDPSIRASWRKYLSPLK